MNLAKYFKLRQKVLLRRFSTDDDLQSAEAIAATVIDCNDEMLEVSLSYQFDKGKGELGGFLSEQMLIIMSEYFGLGVKMTGRVTGISKNGIVRLTPAADLELFSRRRFPRSNVVAQLCHARCTGTLDSCRRQWQLAMERGRPGSKIEPRTINLSAGGASIPLPPPVINGQLYLLYLELNDCKIATWTLAEVVWSKSLETDQLSTGLRFVEIAVKDQIAINLYIIEDLKRQGCDIDWSLKKAELLQVLEF